jgi:hypothetical protein
MNTRTNTSSRSSYIANDGNSGSSSLCRSPVWGPWPDFNFLCLTITFFLLHVRRPLWREDGSVICSAITHRLELRRTHNQISLSHLRLSGTWRARSPYLYPPETGWPSYTPGNLVPFSWPLKTLRANDGGILTGLHTRQNHQKSQSHVTIEQHKSSARFKIKY